MKIAGIYHYDTQLDPKIQHAVSEPYGLEKILAVAKAEGHDVELFLPLEEKFNSDKKEEKRGTEFQSLSETALIEKILEFEPDLACFSMYTCQFPAGKRIAQELKKKNPGLITVAGNRYPSYLKDKVEMPFDFFVINEGEETFKELLEKINNGWNFKEGRGLAFYQDGKKLLTPSRPRIKDLDSFPLALRHPLIMKQAYQGISLPPLSEKPAYALMEYSRGCPSACNFCDNEEVWQKQLTFRSPVKVVDELFSLKEQGVDIFYFIDLNFAASGRKVEQLCREIIEHRVDVSWYCMSNIDSLHGKNDLMKLMKEAGCYKIAWGVESTDDTSLVKMNKKTSGRMLTNERARETLQASLEAGMLNQGYYIIGFPWETASSIIGDAERLKELPLHQLNVGLFTPIPLSNFYDIARGLDPDLEKHDRNTLVYQHPSLDNSTLKRIQEEMHAQFYLSPEFKSRAEQLISVDSRFKKAFDDYFQFLGKGVEI